MGQGVQTPPPPPEKHTYNNIGFLSITGSDPVRNLKNSEYDQEIPQSQIATIIADNSVVS